MQRTRVVWVLLAVSLAVCICEENSSDPEEDNFMSVTDEDEPDKGNDIFVPTKEWQVVKEGQHIPPGLHIRMDFQTGIKEAKLLEEEGGEGEPEDVQDRSDRTAHYGESDRRGIINKRTKVFSPEEVENMLNDLNSETADLSNLPQLASSPQNSQDTGPRKVKEDNLRDTEPVPSALLSNDLPVTRHRDVEEMLMLLSVLANNSSNVTDLCQALEELEYYVHQIHNALDLNGIGGLVLVVRLLNHTHPDVKSWAARVIGSASQSNPPVQELALQYGSLPLLCRLLSLSEAEVVQRRALFALSALLRGNTKEQINFIKNYRGLDILGKSFSGRSRQVQLKAVVLLTDFLNHELINSGSSDDHHLELPVLVYNEVLANGWCENVPVLIHLDQLVVVEKGLLAMKELSGTCSFSRESGRLKELIELLESGAEAELDSEYTNQLLGLCKALLKDIRSQNLDL